MGLFKPAWQCNDWHKAKKAVNRITSQTKLVYIAKNAPRYQTQIEAVERITDEALLFDFAKKEDYRSKAALMKINDPNLLKQCADNLKDVKLRAMAYEKLGDQQYAYFLLAQDLCSFINKNHDSFFTPQNAHDKSVTLSWQKMHDDLFDYLSKITNADMMAQIVTNTAGLHFNRLMALVKEKESAALSFSIGILGKIFQEVKNERISDDHFEEIYRYMRTWELPSYYFKDYVRFMANNSISNMQLNEIQRILEALYRDRNAYRDAILKCNGAIIRYGEKARSYGHGDDTMYFSSTPAVLLNIEQLSLNDIRVTFMHSNTNTHCEGILLHD